MKKLISLLLAMVMVLGLVACGTKNDAPAADAPASAAEPTTLVYGSGDYDSINPIMNEHCEIKHLLFDSLVKLDINGEPVASLAESWSYDEATMTYTFQLRNDVKWHDGKLFSAYDVAYTLSAIKKAESSRLKGYLYGIADYTARSNFVFEIQLTAPNSCFIEQLDFPVIQRGTDCTSVQADYVPVGTSAYRYAPALPGKAHVLEKSPNCVTQKQGKIEQVVLKELPRAADAMYALENREIEAVHVDAELLRTYSPKGNVVTFPYTNRRFTFLGINAEGALADKQVRRAISLVLNREEISKNAMFGRLTASELPFLPSSAYNLPPEENTAAEDPAAILEAAGYTKATDGQWEKETEEGIQRLYIPILVNQENEVRCAAAAEIVKQLRAFGIGAEVRKTDFETYNLWVEEREYSMFIGETLLADDLDVLVFIGSGARFASAGSARMDTLYANAQTAVTQSDKAAAFLELADAFSDEMPIISIGFGQNAVIVNDRIEGEIIPAYGNAFASFFAWNAK